MAEPTARAEAALIVRAEIDDLRREGRNLRALQLGAALAVLTGAATTLKLVAPARTREGCRRRLAPGQWWAFCGETDQGGSVALCRECGGELELAP